MHFSLTFHCVLLLGGIALLSNKVKNVDIQIRFMYKHDIGTPHISHDLLFAPYQDFDYKQLPANPIIIAGHKASTFYDCIAPNNKCSKQNGCVTNYLFIIMLMQAGDLHPNPGPNKPKYPCAMCEKATKWGQRAVCCDQCDVWYHVDCMGMTTENYEALQDSEVSWICAKCGTPNYSNSLFSNATLELTTVIVSRSYLCAAMISLVSHWLLLPPKVTNERIVLDHPGQIFPMVMIVQETLPTNQIQTLKLLNRSLLNQNQNGAKHSSVW